MALKRNLTKFGVNFSDVYTRVDSNNYVSAFKKEVTHGELDMTDPNNPVVVPPTTAWVKTKLIKFNHMTFKNEASFLAQEEPMEQKSEGFYVPQNASEIDILALCYAHLKTLPEFAGSVDV